MIVPPRVLLNPVTMLMVPVELLVNVPPWTVPLFKSNVEAPVKVRLPPLMVALFTEIVPVLAVIVPPALPTVLYWSTAATIPPSPQWSRVCDTAVGVDRFIPDD